MNMQYFMLNKICMEFIDNAFNLMTEGIQPIRQASLDFICKMTVSIGSTSMRLQLMQQMRDTLYFECTKSSEK